MNSKFLILVGMTIGSTAGSLIASLFGAGMFSITSALLSFAGGAVGIYVAYKMVNS